MRPRTFDEMMSLIRAAIVSLAPKARLDLLSPETMFGSLGMTTQELHELVLRITHYFQLGYDELAFLIDDRDTVGSLAEAVLHCESGKVYHRVLASEFALAA